MTEPAKGAEPIDYSDDRSLLEGSALDRARWLLCSEGWLDEAAALDPYIAEAVAAALALVRERVEAERRHLVTRPATDKEAAEEGWLVRKLPAVELDAILAIIDEEAGR